MNIGQNIRKIRELKGYTQDYVAQQLAISQRQYSRIEQNDSDIQLSKLQSISEVLDVTPQQLLGFDEKFIFQNCENAFGNINQTYNAFSEKERELYEKRIDHLEKEVEFLRGELSK